jgi:hypothetical protein
VFNCSIRAVSAIESHTSVTDEPPATVGALDVNELICGNSDVAVSVGVSVDTGVTVSVLVGVSVIVGDAVGVNVRVKVGLGVSVGVCVVVGLGVSLRVNVIVGVLLAVTDGNPARVGNSRTSCESPSSPLLHATARAGTIRASIKIFQIFNFDIRRLTYLP